MQLSDPLKSAAATIVAAGIQRLILGASMLTLLGLATTSVAATRVYRCTDPGGEGIVYSQSPCGEDSEAVELPRNRDDPHRDLIERSRNPSRDSSENHPVRQERLIRAHDERIRQLQHQRAACEDLPLLRTRQGYWFKDFGAIEACRRRTDELIEAERDLLRAELAALRRQPD